MDVARLLTDQEDSGTNTHISNFVADDVREYVNDELVADGKAIWVRHWAVTRNRPGRVVAYSPDRRDTVDRSNLPPNFLADPRMTSRATLYQFGADHKIHVIRTIVGGRFWIKP